MSSRGEDRRVPIKAASSAHMHRSSLARRRNQAIELRKTKKSHLLQRKRGISSASNSSPIKLCHFEVLIKAFLEHDSHEHLHQLGRAVLSHPTQASTCFSQMIQPKQTQTQTPQAYLVTPKALVSGLVGLLVQKDQREDALVVLLSMASAPIVKQADSYYGSTPLSWSSLLIESNTAIPSLISVSSDDGNRMALDVLTHTLQDDSKSVLKLLLPHWPHFVAGLPATATLCATLVRQDYTTRAADLLQPLSIPAIQALLTQSETLAAGTVLLASLSQREDEAIPLLFPDSALLQTLVSLLQSSLSQPAFSRNITAIECALLTLTNIAVSNEGRYVEPMMAQELGLVPCLQQTLDQRMHINSISLCGALLCDSGLPYHVSTTAGVAALVPHMLPLLDDGADAPWEWRRETVCALQVIWSPPPVLEAFDNDAVQAILGDMARDLLLSNDIIRSLTHIVQQRVDMDAVIASMVLLDRLLRTPSLRPAATEHFCAHNGVQALEDLLQNVPTTNDATELAADLLDDFFDDDDDTSTGSNFDNGAAGFSSTGQFTFGLPPQQQPAQQPPQGMGRGRGRVVPSWMEKL